MTSERGFEFFLLSKFFLPVRASPVPSVVRGSFVVKFLFDLILVSRVSNPPPTLAVPIAGERIVRHVTSQHRAAARLHDLRDGPTKRAAADDEAARLLGAGPNFDPGPLSCGVWRRCREYLASSHLSHVEVVAVDAAVPGQP